LITLVPFQYIHLRSRKVLKKKDLAVVIEEELEEEENTIQTHNDEHHEYMIVPITKKYSNLHSNQT
jgi:hypothetical protein